MFIQNRLTMDSRIILIVFSIYLTRVSNGLQCNALACSVNNGTDNVCKNLGKTENRFRILYVLYFNYYSLVLSVASTPA